MPMRLADNSHPVTVWLSSHSSATKGAVKDMTSTS